MNGIAEHFFLDELEYLCAAALDHAATLQRTAAAWLRATRAMSRLRATRKSRAWSAAEKAMYAVQRRRLIRAQNELYRRIESFVAVHGRIVDLLCSTGRSNVKSRAEHLQRLLGVAATSALLNKALRNGWTHFDELLDAEAVSAGSQRSPQIATTRSQVSGGAQALRVIVVDDLEVHVFGRGTFSLPSLFVEIRGLRDAVRHSIHTWGDRW